MISRLYEGVFRVLSVVCAVSVIGALPIAALAQTASPPASDVPGNPAVPGGPQSCSCVAGADAAGMIASSLPEDVTIVTATPEQLSEAVRRVLTNACSDDAFLDLVGGMALAFDSVGRPDFGAAEVQGLAAATRPTLAARIPTSVSTAQESPSACQVQVASAVAAGIEPAAGPGGGAGAGNAGGFGGGAAGGPGIGSFFGNPGNLGGTGFVEPQTAVSPI